MINQHVDKLTARERQILALLAAGLRNREIANELSISEATVENHLHHVYGKIGVRSRTEAVSWVLVKGGLNQNER